MQIQGYEIKIEIEEAVGSFLVKNSYSYTVRNDLLPNDIEAICIELTLRISQPILVWTWHRPPDSLVNDRFEQFLPKADAKNKDGLF